MVSGYCRIIAWEVDWLCSPIKFCDVDHLCAKMKRHIKEVQGDVVVVMPDRDDNNRLQRCAEWRGSSLGVFSVGRIPILVIGQFGCVSGSVGYSDWLHGCAVIFFSPIGVRICYIRRAKSGRSSTNLLRWIALTYIVLLNVLLVGCFAVRIV